MNFIILKYFFALTVFMLIYDCQFNVFQTKFLMHRVAQGAGRKNFIPTKHLNFFLVSVKI